MHMALIEAAGKHHGPVSHLISGIQHTSFYDSGAPLAIAVGLLLLLGLGRLLRSS